MWPLKRKWGTTAAFPHGDIGDNEVSVHRGMGNVRKEVHKGTYTHKWTQ